MAAAAPVLTVRGLAVTFPGRGQPLQAVRGVSFDVHADEVVCLVGESGSGKTVTSLALCGLLPPSARVAGSVMLNGTEVIGAEPRTLQRMRGEDVGFIFQDPATTLNPVLPVGRQISEAPVVHGQLARSQAPARAVQLLREVDIPDPAGRARQYPHQFSGGMRQRAVIAMAMAGRPRLIIADEPTTALDVTVQAQVLDMLARRRRDLGAAFILITHDLGVVAEVADRVLVMYGGRIVESGPVTSIFDHPRHPYTQALLRSTPRLDTATTRLEQIPGQPPSPSALPPGCTFHPRCARSNGRSRCREEEPQLQPSSKSPLPWGEGWVRGLPEDTLVRIDPSPRPSPSREEGEELAACHFADEVPTEQPSSLPATARQTGAPLLQVENLRVHYPLLSGLLRRQTGAIRAVDGVNLTLHQGETLGLVGESGCGKTTTGRAIMGLVHTTAGRVIVDGQDTTHLSRNVLRPVRRHLQYVFQDPYASLNPALTVGEAIAEPLRIHNLFDATGGKRHISQLLDRVGLPKDAAGRYPREFSGGQKQRISIARALALQPRILILDEPVASLDVSIQAQIVNLLQDLQRDLGLAYLFIAHDLSVIRHISHRVAVMYLGRIVEESDAATLYSQPAHPYTQSLLSAVPVPAVSRRRERIILAGEIPNPAAPPSGCTFHPRCFRATAICAVEAPVFAPLPGNRTRVACHHPGPPERAAA